jgi:hypothetical protein
MSGSGPAVDAAGNIYVATGNSDPSGTTYDPQLNLSESVLKISPDLSTVLDFFTPADADELDVEDLDTGSGGVTLLPAISVPNGPAFTAAAVAGGKEGTMYLLNQGGLGGTSGGPIDSFDIGPCWCGESAYLNAAGQWHVVSSGGTDVMVWGLTPRANPPPNWTLQQIPSLTQTIATGQGKQGDTSGGFFTSVSSNQLANPIIWAVGRPVDPTTNAVTLYAFDARDDGVARAPLVAGPAGTWTSAEGNANIVPVVANGRVYVASYQQVAILGVGGGATAAAPAVPTLAAPAAPAAPQAPVPPTAVPQMSALSSPLPPAEHEIWGVVEGVQGHQFSLRTRGGKVVQVDDRAATKAHLSVVATKGSAVEVRGSYNSAGVLVAQTVLRATTSSAFWRPDR